MTNKIIILLAILLFTGAFFYTSSVLTTKNTSSFPQSTAVPVKEELPTVTVVVNNLETPWGIALLPDKSMLVTERPGRVRLIASDFKVLGEPVATIPQVREIGEGGLLGIATHPQFVNNNYVYLYYTYAGDGNATFNRVIRMVFREGKLVNERVLVDNIPGSYNHNGGRIKFGPDGFLYITTGDAENPSQAQDTRSLGGKILRVTDEGKAAPGNPFQNMIYSYGHRNPQGLAWDDKGRLWATEHGRSGVVSGLDELNLIMEGKNYGWPIIQGSQKQLHMETPVLNSGPLNTWAPAGAAYVGGSLFFGGLRGQTLYEAVISGNNVALKEHLVGEYGRLRDVVLGPEGVLYVTTSNRDGRGTPGAKDDRILLINPKKI